MSVTSGVFNRNFESFFWLKKSSEKWALNRKSFFVQRPFFEFFFSQKKRFNVHMNSQFSLKTTLSFHQNLIKLDLHPLMIKWKTSVLKFSLNNEKDSPNVELKNFKTCLVFHKLKRRLECGYFVNSD